MRRLAATALVTSFVACAPGLSPRKPLDQQPIGTGVLGGPSATRPTSAPSQSADSAAPSTTAAGSSSEPEKPAASASPPAAAGTVADLCPPKGQRFDLSRLAAKSGCKGQTKTRSKQLDDIRGNEQLLASMQSNAPEREELVYRLAQGYGALECSLATACTKTRGEKTTPDEMPLVDVKKKTEEYCSTLKSEFPKSKRHCP